MIKTMAAKPSIFALANPTPEIMPEDALDAGAFIVATGRSDYPNQLNNSLAFPGLFKGLLEYNVKQVTDEIKLNCAFAIASIIHDADLNEKYIIPDALDENVVNSICDTINTLFV